MPVQKPSHKVHPVAPGATSSMPQAARNLAVSEYARCQLTCIFQQQRQGISTGLASGRAADHERSPDLEKP